MQPPPRIAVMPLEGTVWFPHTLAPLRLSGWRWMRLLDDALAGSRMFTVSGAGAEGEPLTVGTAGLVRACVKTAGGGAMVLWQGLWRVRLDGLAKGRFYHTATPRLLKPPPLGNRRLIRQLARQIIQTAGWSRDAVPWEWLDGGEPDYDSLADLLADFLVHDPRQRQRLLKCANTQRRLSLLAESLQIAGEPC